MSNSKNISKQLSVIIPCYNESAILPTILPDYIDYCKKHNWQLIVVNDGSQDDSRGILESFASDILLVHNHKLNRGYGAAIKTGIKAAETPWVVTVDADGQHSLEDVKTLFELAEKEDADMVVGARSVTNQSGWYRNFGKWLIKLLVKIVMHVPVKDQNSGMKLYRRDLALECLRYCPNTMAYSDIILLIFVNQRWLVLEAPISIQPRQGGVSTISTRTAIDTISEIFNIIVLFHPMRIFFPLSLFLFIAGVGWMIRCIAYGFELSSGTSFLLISAMIVFLMGMISEQLKRSS